jgi:hypothetical protein
MRDWEDKLQEVLPEGKANVASSARNRRRTSG